MKTSPTFLLRLRARKTGCDLPRIVVTAKDRRTTAARKLSALFALENQVAPKRAQQHLHTDPEAMQPKRPGYYRVSLELPVTLQSRDGIIVRSITINISDSGLAATAPDMFEAGQTIHITLALPFSLPTAQAIKKAEFKSAAKIVWSLPNGQIGVHFIDTPPKASELMEKWITAQYECEQTL